MVDKMTRNERDDIMNRARRNKALAETMRGPDGRGDDFMLEAFMATFHPEYQKDRRKMRELHQATRKRSKQA